MENLSDKLLKEKKLPMHMPGHKRNIALFPHLEGISAEQDITEITGFDNLHGACGILKKSMDAAAQLRGVKSAFYLINGSTCGILAAVTACVPYGGKIIMARNCHKSVYNAAGLVCANTVYLISDHEPLTGGYGCISPETVEDAVKKNTDASLIVITSPTYEGIVSDISSISRIAHMANIPVLVDAAHGAHFGFGNFPQSASACGADISVESLHKTLSSLTQTSVCYLSGNIVSPDLIAEKLAVFESSSPSYLLLASIDGCINQLRNESDRLFSSWQSALKRFYIKAQNFKNIHLLDNTDGSFFDLDNSKIVIFAENISGKTMFSRLYEYGIECEMAAPGYVLAMTGIGDTDKSLSKLFNALMEIDREIPALPKNFTPFPLYPPLPPRELLPWENSGRPCEAVDIRRAVGRISAESIWAYPPGIPILVPGEKISSDAADVMNSYSRCGIELSSAEKDKILVIK